MAEVRGGRGGEEGKDQDGWMSWGGGVKNKEVGRDAS